MAAYTRYSEFEKSLGIAKNILRNRLTLLVENGLMKKVEVGQHGTRFEYHLTEKGRDLFPVMVAFFQWSDKWIPEKKRSQFALCDAKHQQPISELAINDIDGKRLGVEDIVRIARHK